MCPIESFPVNIWKSMIDIHLTAPFLLVRYFLPFMKQKGKAITFKVSKGLELMTFECCTHYRRRGVC